MALPLPSPNPAQQAIPYKIYRILVSANQNSSTSGYAAIGELGLYETEDSTVNIALASAGAVATASSVTGSSVAANAIDGNDSTTWESVSGTFPHWLTVTLPAARIVRKFRLKHTTWPNETPRDFRFQGSNDGTTWYDIATVTGWTNSNEYYRAGGYSIKGRSLHADGTPLVSIELYEWDTGVMLNRVTPDANGLWGFDTSFGSVSKKYLVVHKGRDGYKPQADGPVTPYKTIV